MQDFLEDILVEVTQDTYSAVRFLYDALVNESNSTYGADEIDKILQNVVHGVSSASQ